ncbi:Putative acyl-CoA dehydrogenase AidB [Cytospora mali]|uniref:Acyl-CoA dehydrogenase AidB n=1 Tax=Cytospora mali TaxID=578113 RepID=A0A194V5A3_CYTMA|nr:Putative acyl-CoA dehydrogenase AidB [Valsa mali var. pyri (nom. inval.)]
MQSASADKGFFQQQPILKNQLLDDPSYQRILRLFLPSSVKSAIEPELQDLGDKVLTTAIFDCISDAERNLPYLCGGGRDAFGQPRSDSLVVTEGWTNLQNFGIQNGMVAYNYDHDHLQYTRVIQMLRLFLWEASSANTTCPAAMTDGAARLLQRHLADPRLDEVRRGVFQNAYDHLTSRDPTYAWTSGQWMTERPGGSDVSQTESVATYMPFTGNVPPTDTNGDIPLGPWSISGFKWFSSATDSSITILLARTTPDKGVSAFFAPMRRYNPSFLSPTGQRGGVELNGIKIVRLKDKMGTKSLPTAELELKNMRGWLIGHEGKGIQEIATILNITRVHSTIAALGYLGRGLGVAKAYALVREIGATKGKRIPLCKSPLHMRTLADMTVEYHSMMMLTFYTTYLLGLDEKLSEPGSSDRDLSNKSLKALTPPPRHIAPLLRVLSSLHKSYCCKHSIPLMYGCMESLGGVGYLNNAESEHLNLSRLFRDICVLATWEGTTDVLATDTLRALKHPVEGPASLGALRWFLESNTMALRALAEWERMKMRLERHTQDELLSDARDICFRLAEILMTALLEIDAASDENAAAKSMLDRYLKKKGFTDAASSQSILIEDTLEVDTAIVFGKAGLDNSGGELSSKL